MKTMDNKENVIIRRAVPQDESFWLSLDEHISRSDLAYKISAGACYVLVVAGDNAGILRYGLFWDNVPFCKMLVVAPGYRGRGFGSAMMRRWERDMADLGYCAALTSTRADETARFFYQKLGYRKCGSIWPFWESSRPPEELFFVKSLLPPPRGYFLKSFL